MSSDATLFLGNLSPSVTDTIETESGAVDLTGATVRFKMRSTTSATLVVDQLAVIVSAVNGTVRYDWQTADVATAGLFLAWFEVTLASGKKQDTPEFAVRILAHTKPVTALTTLAAVRAYEMFRANESYQDELIRDTIDRASKAIVNNAEREFHLSGTLTRTFSYSGHFVSVAPYDLQSVTVVSLDPESTNPTALVADDYRLVPIHKPDGVCYGLRLKTWRYPTYFDFAQVAITGVWGFPTVPADIEQACIMTVCSWLRKTPTVGFPAGDETEDGSAIPTPALRLLHPYKRKVAL